LFENRKNSATITTTMTAIGSTRNYVTFRQAIISSDVKGSGVGVFDLLERVKTDSKMAQQLVGKVTVWQHWKILIEVGVCKNAIGAVFCHLFHWRTASTYSQNT
jgi:hypothetical protein